MRATEGEAAGPLAANLSTRRKAARVGQDAVGIAGGSQHIARNAGRACRSSLEVGRNSAQLSARALLLVEDDDSHSRAILAGHLGEHWQFQAARRAARRIEDFKDGRRQVRHEGHLYDPRH